MSLITFAKSPTPESRTLVLLNEGWLVTIDTWFEDVCSPPLESIFLHCKSIRVLNFLGDDGFLK